MLMSFAQVLFLIPKNPPPQLDVSFSKPFREFVALCLQRDPKDVCDPLQPGPMPARSARAT